MALTADQLMRLATMTYLHRVGCEFDDAFSLLRVRGIARKAQPKTELNYMRPFLNVIRFTHGLFVKCYLWLPA
jgi:hypothetical protein